MNINSKNIPLAYGQEAMWFIYQIAPESVAYNIFITAKINSYLNIATVNRVWQKIIEHHPILRSTYSLYEGKPVQQVNQKQHFSVEVIDASKWSLDQLREKIYAIADTPFNLEQDSVLRVNLFTRSPEDHILLLTMHHIAGDMWSFDLLLSEFQTLYAREVEPVSQQQTEAAPDSLNGNKSYADFVRWQSEMLSGSKGEKQWQYWQQKLAGELPILNLLTDKPHPPVQTYQGASNIIKLDEQLTEKLNNLALATGTTLYQILLAAFYILLYRYTNQTDILIGSPMRGRWGKEFKEIVGYFSNLTVLRVSVLENATFTELLAQVSKTVRQAQKHQDYPFSLLAEQLQQQRDPSRHPLCQVSFTWQAQTWCQAKENYLHSQEPVLPMQPYLLGQRGAQMDLSLMVREAQGVLEPCWQYNTDLFDASTIERMTGHFVTLLSGIVAHPQEEICQLPLLTAAEQQQLLVEWNDTAVDYPVDKCLHQLFEQQVQRTPDAVAVVYENEQLTYQQLNERANSLAHYLRSLGVGADVLVGLCVERSLEMVVGLLGILKAGGAYVPLDPEYPQERLSLMLTDSQVSIILTQEKLVNKLGDRLRRGFAESKVSVICLDSNWDIINQQTQHNPIETVKAKNLAYVMYTSGSTGQPKGVSIIHQGVVRLVKQTDYVSFSEQDVFLQVAPIAFDAATFEIWGALLNGGKLVLYPANTPSINELGQVIEQYQVTTLWLTAGLFHLMVDENIEALKSLRQLVAGGDVLSVPHVQKFLQTVENCQLINGYGPTENTTFTCCYQIPKSLSSDVSVPIGRAIANTQVYILDSYLQPVPVGVPGELHIGGAGLARGYLNRPELTQEKFIPNPFDTAANSRLYKTGDLARYLPSGEIEYLGRIDNQVKIRGFRIELGEIETILNQQEQVQTSCVIARSDVPGDKRLVAYIVPEQTAPTQKQLREYLKGLMPEYMVPSAFVLLENLPLTPNGKIDRRALPKPDLDSEQQDQYAPPRTPTEEILAQLWAVILNLKQVGIHDNFFELGGHSLLATQLISRIRSHLQVELPLRQLFAAPTVASLAQIIQQSNNLQQNLSPIVKRDNNSDLPLSYAQTRLWFIDQFQPDTASYNIPFALRLEGNLQVTALEQSIQEIIQRHEALRTNFITIDGQANQIINSQINWTISVEDWSNVSTNHQEIDVVELLQQQAIAPFDLGNDCLIRATLVTLSGSEHILFLCMHHIVSDGWSMGVFVQELQALYNAYSQGQPSPLAPLAIQYADFAQWQRQWLQGEVLQSQLSYWQSQLQDAPALLSLPTDRPRPAVQTFVGAHQQFALSVELTQKLTQLSQSQGVTLFMTLLAGYKTLLYRYTGVSDIVVGSPIANRNHSEIEGLIGFFVNTLVLRTDLSENPRFSDLLARVREVALGAYAHQDLPFEMLVEALQPERDLSYTPLFHM